MAGLHDVIHGRWSFSTPTTDASVAFFTAVCLHVFPNDISKKPTQLVSPNVTYKMSHDESWKPIYFGVKRSKVKVTMSASDFRQKVADAYVSYAGFYLL